MSPRKLSRDVMATINPVLIVLIAILMVSASLVGFVLIDDGEDSPKVPVAGIGDTVKIDYIGQFDDGRVFDTSLLEVAEDNAMYPKSLDFTLRTSYSPLEFEIGAGAVITGFDEAVRGMRLNQTMVVEIPADEAYGEIPESSLVTIDQQVTVPVYEVLGQDEFFETYNQTAVIGLVVEDEFFGWDVVVLEVNEDADEVLVQNAPDLGERFAVYGEPDSEDPTGWYAEVITLGPENIVVSHLLTPDDEGYVKGVDASGNEFIIHDVANGEIVLNYASEVVGKTLTFTITLVEIL
jgi:FKBP-type peptidyl-prolyl cis-trans isomerase 2